MLILGEPVSLKDNLLKSFREHQLLWAILFVTIIFDFVTTILFMSQYGIRVEKNMVVRWQRFPHACGTATGLAGGAGTIGGFAIPWITGTIGDGVGIAIAMGSLGVWSLAIALGSEGARRDRARAQAAQVI